MKLPERLRVMEEATRAAYVETIRLEVERNRADQRNSWEALVSAVREDLGDDLAEIALRDGMPAGFGGSVQHTFYFHFDGHTEISAIYSRSTSTQKVNEEWVATFKWTRTAHFSRSSDGRKWRIAKYERGWEEWLDWDTDPQQKQDCPRYTDDLGEALRLAAEFEAERKVYATQEPPPAREAAPGAGAGDNTKTSEDS